MMKKMLMKMMEIIAMNIMIAIMTVIVLVNFVSLAQGCPTFFQGGPLSELGHRCKVTLHLTKL